MSGMEETTPKTIRTPEEQAEWEENERLLDELAAYARTVVPYTEAELEALHAAMDHAEHGA